MPSVDDRLRALGAQIRNLRTNAELTQNDLGERAGLVGKYISEIERGTRDIPFSTLLAVIEDGLGMQLDIQVRRTRSEVPKLAAAIDALPDEQRRQMIAILRDLLKLALP